MIKKCCVYLVCLSILVGSFGAGFVIAGKSEKLPQMLRVQVDNVTIVESKRRSKIIAAVSANLGRKITIGPRKDFKESVYHMVSLAQEGKTVNSGSFGIGSNLNDIKSAWKATGEYKRRNSKMVLYKNKCLSFISSKGSSNVSEVSCHSFYGSPSLPSITSFKQELGKPYLEYHFPDIIKEGSKKGADILQRLYKKGIAKKGSNLEEAYECGDFDLNIVVYKANRYFFYVTECRICNNSDIYRSVGIRTDASIFENPWLV